MATGGKNSFCKEKPLLVVAALDWGLGHTTRSIPLIHELLALGCEIVIACNSIQKKIYSAEFPSLRYEELQGYDVSYHRKKWRTRLKIAFQSGKILTRINQENAWLDAFVKENSVCALISDNRYGLFHPGIHTVFITHQLSIRTGFGKLVDKISQAFLYKYINRFSECWVPDFNQNSKLAGSLSHPENAPSVPVHYIGALSRFEVCDQGTEFLYDLLILLSGPEPQRTILEKILLQQLQSARIKIALVRGLPASESVVPNANATVYNHLDAQGLNKLICQSKLVICRSGYTTVMDMVKLKKKMIVIPTPGQTEQEYLGHYLSEKHLALNISQHQFKLSKALEAADKFPFQQIAGDMNAYRIVLKDFVSRISS